MSVIDDLNTAVADYANSDCDIKIVGFSVTTGSSTTTLNPKEYFQYQVKVSNNGKLNMKNVKIRVNGSDWAKVALSGSTGVFDKTALLDPTPPINIDPGQSFTTGFFRGYATAGTPSSATEVIVTAQIDGWDAELDSILNDSSGSGMANGTLMQAVYPG